MNGFLRRASLTLAVTLVSALAAATVASAVTVRASDTTEGRAAAFAEGAKPPASIKLRTCRSAPYYDGRLIRYRVRMHRFSDTNAPQKLQMRLDVWQKLDEAKKFKKLKAEGLGAWTSSTDAAQVYQRDLELTNVETAAAYKLRVGFRWVGADGKPEWRRSLTSKPCKQRVKLPRLGITKATAVQVPGTPQVTHKLTVMNNGRSEAVSVPVAVYVDAVPVFATIDSIGPKQAQDVLITAPSCTNGAAAAIDPLKSLLRLNADARQLFQIPSCR